jgi:hypothetical protein
MSETNTPVQFISFSLLATYTFGQAQSSGYAGFY